MEGSGHQKTTVQSSGVLGSVGGLGLYVSVGCIEELRAY